ncbi:hypothetical protein J6590_041803 [Homalodisca vitripennis]|nr:hypothetical protein J6590_041803 [Homalodisca vitripennis]
MDEYGMVSAGCIGSGRLLPGTEHEDNHTGKQCSPSNTYDKNKFLAHFQPLANRDETCSAML